MESLTKKQKYVYDHGLPFPEDLVTDVIEPIIADLKRVPAILVIDGAPGTGKTTLAVHIEDYIIGKPVPLEKGSPAIAFGGTDILTKAEECSALGWRVATLDEADLDRRGSLTKFNSNLLGFFREYRSLAILIIVIIQNVGWLDKRLFELGVVEGLIHLHDPGKEFTRYQVYDLENLAYLLMRMEKLGLRSRKAYSIVHGYKRGQFLNLPPARREALEILSNSQKKESRKKRVKKSLSIDKSILGDKK